MRFDDRVVIVTGGALGIGRAAVELFAERGAAVAILDWDEAGGKDACRHVEVAGGTAIFQRLDVSKAADVQAAVETAFAEFGRVDSLVVSAGIQRYGTALTTDDTQWDEVINVNLRGAWNAA